MSIMNEWMEQLTLPRGRINAVRGVSDAIDAHSKTP